MFNIPIQPLFILITLFINLKISKMGSGSINNQAQQQQKTSYKETIEQNIKNGRLKLDHQSNIYEKCQYLQLHYGEYSAEFQELYLTHNMISVEFMNLLAKMDLTNLKALVLSNNDISCQALKSIKEMPLRTLQYLFLDHNLIGNDGCYYLALTNLQSLLTLDLNNNKIEDEGCKNLARANLPNLRTLLICHNKFYEKGLMYLSKGEWPLLAFIQARNNLFEPNKQLQRLQFRSDVKAFRLEIQ